MLGPQQLIFNMYTKPVILSRIMNCDMSFIDLIAPLSAEEILSLTYEGGTVLYYLMMSLHIVCGVDDVDSNNAMKRQVEKLLLEAVSTSESILQSGDQKKFLQFATQDKVSELGEIRDKLKMLYASVAGKVSRTLLDAMSSDEDVTEPDQEILRQEKIESKVRIFNSAINVIKIISNTINSSVARGEVSIQQVSNFLSYCDVSAESHIPDTMSFLNRLYFLITDRDLSDCMRELVSTFLVSFSQYTLDTCGRNAIHYAVNMCCYEEQERFLSETIQPIVCSRPLVARTLDKSGNNLIHYAVSSPYVNFKIIKYLCENFPDMVMTKNVHGDTPLHIMANTYFVYFARVSVFFDFTCGRSLKKLQDFASISEIREYFSKMSAENVILSNKRAAYLRDCLQCFRLLITSVPLRGIFEEKNKADCTVYSILGDSIYYISSGNIEALLRNFSEVSSTLPIYDDRIDSQYKKCVSLYFAGGHEQICTQKKKCERLFYLDARNIYNLMSNKFTELCGTRTGCKYIVESGNFNFYIVCLGLVLLSFLFILNTIVIFRVEPIFGIERSVYRTTLFLVVSINVFIAFCVSSVLFCKFVDCDNKKLIERGEANISEILASHLDVKRIDIDRESKSV